ncbi:MAG: sigma-70 family RNA polymerase sigma factor [Acidobacteriota bacterium]
MSKLPVIVAMEESLGDEAGREQDIEATYTHSTWIEAIFEKVFLQNYARIVTLLFRLVGDRARAEELASDVFWKLYRQPFSHTREHNWGGWLYRTALYLGLDSLRADARRKHYERVACQTALLSDLPADPLDEIYRAEQRQRVRAVLLKLKPIQTQLLLLRNGGLSYKEIAEALDIKVNSIGTLIARAEAEFEKRYYEMYENKE